MCSPPQGELFIIVFLLENTEEFDLDDHDVVAGPQEDHSYSAVPGNLGGGDCDVAPPGQIQSLAGDHETGTGE